MEIIIQVLLLTIGFVMLIKGADWFVHGASKIADKFGIPQIIIALTIVAMGTSAPEAAVSISAAVKGSAGITIGNVLGSNILNIFVILGITSIMKVISVPKSSIKYEIPFMIGVSCILAFIGLSDNSIGRMDAVILWTLMIVYLVYLLKSAQNGKKDTSKEELQQKQNLSVISLLFFVVIGMGLIVWGSDIAVDATTNIARYFGMSERIIGLTIVAFGTSLPELATSVMAAYRGNADIAIGNIVGSNIFNILFVVGTTAVISPVVYSPTFFVDSIVMIIATVLLFLCVLKSKKLNRINGGIMLGVYAAYFIYLIK